MFRKLIGLGLLVIFILSCSINDTGNIEQDTGNVKQNVSNPVFSKDEGQYIGKQTIKITTQTLGATIRYTLDGTEPNENKGIIYENGVEINATTTLKAIAFKSGMVKSEVKTAVFNIMVWKGEFNSPPSNPINGWVYYNTTDCISYIYDGSKWQILAKDGKNGKDGKDAPTSPKQSTIKLIVDGVEIENYQNTIDLGSLKEGEYFKDILFEIENTGNEPIFFFNSPNKVKIMDNSNAYLDSDIDKDIIKSGERSTFKILVSETNEKKDLCIDAIILLVDGYGLKSIHFNMLIKTNGLPNTFSGLDNYESFPDSEITMHGSSINWGGTAYDGITPTMKKIGDNLHVKIIKIENEDFMPTWLKDREDRVGNFGFMFGHKDYAGTYYGSTEEGEVRIDFGFSNIKEGPSGSGFGTFYYNVEYGKRYVFILDTKNLTVLFLPM